MRKNPLIVFLVIVTIVIAGTAAFFLYRSYNQGQNKEQISQARELVSAGRFQEAINKVDEILSSDPNSVEANQVKADATQLLQNYDLCRETYNKLFEITQNNFYKDRVDFIEYGSVPSNSLAGGESIASPLGNFIVTYDSDPTKGANPVYSYNLWLVNGSEKQSVFLDEGTSAFINDLNLWGNRLYFKSSQGIKMLDLYSQTVSDVVIDGTAGGTPTDYNKIENLTIYRGEFYFIQTVVRTSYTESNTVSKCNLDGQGVTTVVDYQGLTGVGIVSINSFFPMVDRVYFRTTNNTVFALKVQIGGNTTTLIESEYLGDDFAVSQTDLYISGTNDSSLQIFKVNLSDTSVTSVAGASPVSTALGLSTIGEGLYYFGSDGLDQVNLTTGEIIPLGLPLDSATERADIYITGNDLIIIQSGNYDGSYKTIVNSIDRNNPANNTLLFRGNE